MSNNWNESFTALVNAYQQLPKADAKPEVKRLPSGVFISQTDSSSSNNSIEESHRPKKRKMDDSDIFSTNAIRTKSTRGLNQMCCEFEESVTLDEDKIVKLPTLIKEMNMPQPQQIAQVSVFAKDYLMKIANNTNRTLNTVRAEWEASKGELETCLSMIKNAGLSDSYDDAKYIVSKIQESSSFVCGGNFSELNHIVPDWQFTKHTVLELANFVEIVEESKMTFIEPLTGDLISDAAKLNQLIVNKKPLFRNMLRNDYIAWKVLGFPVLEVEHILNSLRERINIQAWAILNQTFQKMTKCSRLEKESRGIVSQSVQLVNETVDLLGIGKFNSELLNNTVRLVLCYIELALKEIRDLLSEKTHIRFPDSKICHIYEHIIQVLGFMKNNQTQVDESIPSVDSMMEDQIDDLPTILPSNYHLLYHPTIELGLILCEYCGKRRPSENKFLPFMFSLAKRYIVLVAEIMKFVLEDEVFNFGKSLKNDPLFKPI